MRLVSEGSASNLLMALMFYMIRMDQQLSPTSDSNWFSVISDCNRWKDLCGWQNQLDGIGFSFNQSFWYFILFHFVRMNVQNARIFLSLLLVRVISASICGWEACEECVDARLVIPHWEGNKVWFSIILFYFVGKRNAILPMQPISLRL